MKNTMVRAYWAALLVPVALLGGALISQYGFGLKPCQMCMWQRWPHLAAIGLALGGLLLRQSNLGSSSGLWLIRASALAIAISGAIGVFHAGVEYHWWQGLTDCSTMGGIAPGSILTTTITNGAPRCDEVQFSLYGISLAGFNAIFSLAAAAYIGLKMRTT